MKEGYKAYEPSAWESRVDKAISVVAPQWHHRRIVARERTNYFRYLSAYATSARTNTPPGATGETMRGAREKIQVMWNAINLIDNSGLCTSLLNKFAMYICGTLRWQSRCGDKAIADEYEDYMRIKTGRGLDVTNRYSLRQMCLLDIRGIALKGDIGCNIVREGNDLFLQGIEAERIGNPFDWQMTNNYVRGLRLDDSGIIQAADIFYRDRMSALFQFDQTIPLRDKRGLPRFLFLVNPISYDDYRGVSMFKSAIETSTYIDRMREYELQALMWASSQSGVYHTKSGALPEALPFDSIAPLIDPSGNRIDTYQVRPNTVTAIGVGEDVSMFQHDRPSPNILGMIKDTIRDICTGFGVSFEFGWDMSGLNGPAVRGVSAQDARAFEVWQNLLRESKLDPVAGLILGNGIANKEIPFHPNWDRWQWFFPAKSTIDVGRESAANIEEIDAGINSAANVAAENSMDVGEITAQRALETAAKIEAAKEVAKEVGDGVMWQEVYNYMYPPRSRGGFGTVGGARPMPMPSVDGGGPPRDGGVDIGADGQDQTDTGNERMRYRLRFTGDGMEVWYSPTQSRDERGRFADEGATVRVSGSADGRFTGDANVTVIDPFSNKGEVSHTDSRGEHYDKHGHRVIPKMTVELDRSKRKLPPLRFEAHHHQVSAPKPPRTKAEWMDRYEKAVTKAKPEAKGRMDWDTAAYLHGTGKSPEEAAKAFLFRAEHEWFRPDQSRDEKGRFADEGKGSLDKGYQQPGEEGAAAGEGKAKEAPAAEASADEPTGIDKEIADYKPDRSLSDPAKRVSIKSIAPGTSYKAYSKTPFFNSVNKLQGSTVDGKQPLDNGVPDYIEQRDLLFDTIPVTQVSLKHAIVTQPYVNKDRIKELVDDPSKGGIDPATGRTKAVQVVKQGGNLYLVNGHHRAMADLMRDPNAKIDAHVLDLDYPEPTPPKSDKGVVDYVAELHKMPTYKTIVDRLNALGATNGEREAWSYNKHLGPDGKLTPERLAEHEKIVSAAYNPEATVPPDQTPKAIFLIGKPAAGKSQALQKRLAEFGPVTQIGADALRSGLSDYRGWNAAATQYEAKMLTTELQDRALKGHQNIVFDETGGNVSKTLDRMKALAANGPDGKPRYEVHVIHVDSPMYQTVHRSWKRFEGEGRFVEPDYQVNVVDDQPIETYKLARDSGVLESWEDVDNKNFAGIVREQGRRKK